VHDAVATVNLLAQPLRDGILSMEHLVRVQVCCAPSTIVVQRAQRMIHHRFPLPVARGRLAATRAPTPPCGCCAATRSSGPSRPA